MKLTGKLKQDFLLFFNTNRRGTEVSYYQLPELFQNALIIEYLDSVGVYILPSKALFSKHWKYIIGGYNQAGLLFNSRTEAINAAIEKANEIINKI